MKAVTVSVLMGKFYGEAAKISSGTEYAYSPERLIVEARKPRKEAMAAFVGNELAGWLLHRVGKRECEIEALVVAAKFRRMGVASAMVSRLKDWSMQNGRYETLQAVVSEYDLGSQLFFKSLGFVVKDAEWSDERYRFRWHCNVDAWH